MLNRKGRERERERERERDCEKGMRGQFQKRVKSDREGIYIREGSKSEELVGWLVGFYGISTFVCYLMLNPFLYKTVLFQTILLSMSTQINCQKHFYFKQFSLSKQF